MPPDFDADLAAYQDDRRLADQSERTIDAYSGELRKFAVWGDATGQDTLTMRAAKAYLVATHRRAPWVAFMAARAIKSFGRWYAGEYDVADPFAALAYVKAPKGRPQPTASPVDVDTLLAACAGDDLRARRDHAIVNVLWSTGCRRSEVAALRWSDVDFVNGTVVIVKSKNGRPRTARLSREALRSLRRYRRELAASDLGFRRGLVESIWHSSTSATPLSSNGVYQALAARCKTAGVHLPAHAFRRGLATEWLRRGGSETLLRQVAGWEDSRMVSIYVRAVAAETALAEHERLFH